MCCTHLQVFVFFLINSCIIFYLLIRQFISIPRPDMLCKRISVNVLTCSNTSHNAVSGIQSFVHLGMFWLKILFLCLISLLLQDIIGPTFHPQLHTCDGFFKILQNEQTHRNNTIAAQNKWGSNYDAVALVCYVFIKTLFLHSCHVGSVLPWRCAH